MNDSRELKDDRDRPATDFFDGPGAKQRCARRSVRSPNERCIKSEDHEGEHRFGSLYDAWGERDFEWTDRQADHLQSVQDTIEEEVGSRYMDGAAEHGGHLDDMGMELLLDNAIEEAVDTLVYLITLRDKLARLIRRQTTAGT